MHVYTFSEARQHLSALLEQASKEGQVCIKRRDGQSFVIKPQVRKKSPLDVKGTDLNLSADEIVDIVRESRSRD